MAESQPDTGTDAPTQDAPSDQQPDTGDLAKEVEKWKAQARKHEDRAKANADAAKKLATLEQQSMTDLEKAVTQARTEAAAEAAKTFGARLVDAEVKAAAAGRNVDLDALLEGMDRSRFLTDDGEPDVDAITAWVDRIAPQGTDTTEAPTPPFVVDLGQGNRGEAPTSNSDPLLKALTGIIGVSPGR